MINSDADNNDIIEMLNTIGNQHINDRSDDYPRNTVLIAATKNETRYAVLLHILQIGNIDINIRNNKNETALIVATQYANINAVDKIKDNLPNGLQDINLTDNTGRIALDWANWMIITCRNITDYPEYIENEEIDLPRNIYPSNLCDMLNGQTLQTLPILIGKYYTIETILYYFMLDSEGETTGPEDDFY